MASPKRANFDNTQKCAFRASDIVGDFSSMVFWVPRVVGIIKKQNTKNCVKYQIGKEERNNTGRFDNVENIYKF
jgi:hypothetical protein